MKADGQDIARSARVHGSSKPSLPQGRASGAAALSIASFLGSAPAVSLRAGCRLCAVLLLVGGWDAGSVAVAQSVPAPLPPAPAPPPPPSTEPVPSPREQAVTEPKAPAVPEAITPPVPEAEPAEGRPVATDPPQGVVGSGDAAPASPAVQGPLEVTDAPPSVVTSAGTYRPNPLPRGSVVAVLPVRGGEEDSGGVTSAQLSAIRAQAERELVGVFKGLGYRVLSPQQARSLITDPRMAESCLSALGRCNYRALLAPLGAGAIVAGALWIRDGQPVEIFVRVTREYSEGTATREVDGARFLPAFKDAAQASLLRAEHPLAISVRVETEPKGALLTVDRQREAKAPANLALSPGKHLLVVSHPGFVTRSMFVDVPEAATGAVVQKVTLIADTGSAGPMELSDLVGNTGHGLTTGSSSPFEDYMTDYIVGGVLALGSVALLTAAVATAVADGRCVEQDPHARRCVIEEDGNATPLFVGAVVTGVTAAALFTLTPLTDLRETAGLQLSTSF